MNIKLYQAVPVLDWSQKNPHEDYRKYPNDFIDGVTHVLVPVEDQWISVEDRLPKSGEYVLCYTSMGGMSRMVENSWELHTEQNEDWFKKNFSHWMPLPTSPKDTEQLKPIDK